ncbi:MAG: HNH endonuclease [Desulfobacterales bacterium]|nr:HNH endonuclease [Desulfobacterales bacterium]
MPEKRVSAEQRRIVTERAKKCCEYCLSQSRFATESFSVEHVIPRFLGGQTELKNLALACQGCNGHKHVRIRGYDSVSGNEVNLYNPRIHKWNEHFRWNDDFALIIGLTPEGRATLETLKLNREGLVNLRRVLYEAGKHPP